MTDAITIYDVGLDEERPVTQADVEQLTRGVAVMSRHRSAARYLDALSRDALTGVLPMERFHAIITSLELSYEPAQKLTWQHSRLPDRSAA